MTLWIQNQPREGSYVSSGAEHFVPINWMCKKQTSVSHSSTESEIIPLDAGLRMDGPLSLPLGHCNWGVSLNKQHCKAMQTSPRRLVRDRRPFHQKKTKTKTEQLSNVDFAPTNTHSSQGESQLYIFEDNEAVIKMIIKGRSPTMRHVSRTHRVAFDWLFDRINLDPKI